MRIILNSCLIALGSDLASAATDCCQCTGNPAWDSPYVEGQFADVLHDDDVYDDGKLTKLLFGNVDLHSPLVLRFRDDDGKWSIYRGDKPTIDEMYNLIAEDTRKRLTGEKEWIQNDQREFREELKNNPVIEQDGVEFRLMEERIRTFEELATYTFNPDTPRHQTLSEVVIVKSIKKGHLIKEVQVPVNLKNSGKIEFRTHILGNWNWWMVERCQHGGCRGHNWPVVGIKENLFADSMPQFDNKFEGKFDKRDWHDDYTMYYYNSKLLRAQNIPMRALDIALESKRFTKIAELEKKAERRRRRRKLLESLYR